jgi:hypothetical protein
LWKAPGTGLGSWEQWQRLLQKSIQLGTLNDCYWPTETWREYWRVGLGPILATRFQSGLLDNPLCCSTSSTKWELMSAYCVRTMTMTVPIDNGG